MEERPISTSSSYNKQPYRSPSSRQISISRSAEERTTFLNVSGLRDNRRTSPLATRSETAVDGSDSDEEESDQDRTIRQGSRGRASTSQNSQEKTPEKSTPSKGKGKGKEKEKTKGKEYQTVAATKMGGTQYGPQQAGGSCSSSNRQQSSTSRSSTTTNSSASSPAQGHQGSGSQQRKDRTEKPKNRQNLVSGVFVRY